MANADGGEEEEHTPQNGQNSQNTNEVPTTEKSNGNDITDSTTESNDRGRGRGRGRGAGRGRGRNRGRGRASGRGTGRGQTEQDNNRNDVSSNSQTRGRGDIRGRGRTRGRGRGRGHGRGRGRGGGSLSRLDRQSTAIDENKVDSSVGLKNDDSEGTSLAPSRIKTSQDVQASNFSESKQEVTHSKTSQFRRSVSETPTKSRNSTARQKSPSIKSTRTQLRPETTQSVISSIGSVSLPKTPMSVVGHQTKNESEKPASTAQRIKENKSSGMSIFTVGRLKSLFSRKTKSKEQVTSSNVESVPLGNETRNTAVESANPNQSQESGTKSVSVNDVGKSRQNDSRDKSVLENNGNQSQSSVPIAKISTSEPPEARATSNKSAHSNDSPDDQKERKDKANGDTKTEKDNTENHPESEQKEISDSKSAVTEGVMVDLDPASELNGQTVNPEVSNQNETPDKENNTRPVVFINTNFTQNRDLLRSLGGVLTGKTSTNALSEAAQPKTSSDSNVQQNQATFSQPPAQTFMMPMPQYSYVQMPQMFQMPQPMMHPLSMPYGLPSYNMYDYHLMNQMNPYPYGYPYQPQVPQQMPYPQNVAETGSIANPVPSLHFERTPPSSKSDVLKTFRKKEKEKYGHYTIYDSIGQDLHESRENTPVIKSYNDDIPTASFGSTIPANFKINDSLYHNLPPARITEVMETGQRSNPNMTGKGNHKRKKDKRKETEETIEEILKREHEEILKMEKLREELSKRNELEKTLTSDMTDMLALIEKGKTVSKETASLVKGALVDTGGLDNDDDDNDDIDAILAEFKHRVKKENQPNPYEHRDPESIVGSEADDKEFSGLLRFIETGKEYSSSDEESMDDPERLLNEMKQDATPVGLKEQQKDVEDTEPEGTIESEGKMGETDEEEKRVKIADLPFMSDTNAEKYDGTNRELRKMLKELGEELKQSDNDADVQSVRTPDSLEAEDRVKLFASPDISLIISKDVRQAMENRQKVRDRLAMLQERDHAIAELLLNLNQETEDAEMYAKEREKRIGDRIIEGTKGRAENMLGVAENALSVAKGVLPDASV